MAGVVGSLLVKLSAVTAEFDKAMDKSAGKVKGVENTIGKTALGTAIGIGISKGVGFLANGIKDAAAAIPELLSQMDDVTKQAQKIGIDTRSFLSLDVIAKESATSIETVGAAIQKMKVKIAENNGVPSLGFSKEQLQKLGVGGSFEAIAKKISEISDPIARAKAEVDAFGKSGVELDSVIMNLSSGYSAWADEIADPKAVEALARAGDAIEKFGRKAKNTGIDVLGYLANDWNEWIAGIENSSGALEAIARIASGYKAGGDKAIEILDNLKRKQDAMKDFKPDFTEAEKELVKMREMFKKAGGTDAEKRKIDFMETHPDAKRIEEFDKLNGLIEAQNELEEMGKKIEQERNQQLEKAKSNWDSLMQKAQDMVKAADPIAGYAEKIRDLRRALGEGKITDAQFQATMKIERGKTLDDLAKDFKPADLVPALIMGTKEAYMAIAKGANPQLAETRKTNIKLDQIKEKLNFAETSL